MLCFAIALLTLAATVGPLSVESTPAFYVVGIAHRTTNSKERSADGIIGKTWQQFMSEHMSDRIPHQASNDYFAVYTDYESDQNGAYTYLLGKRVSSTDNIPPELTCKKIPAGRYVVLTSEKGPLAQVVPKLWQRIWSLSPEELGGKRAFQADYEVYDARAANPQSGQADVHLGLK